MLSGVRIRVLQAAAALTLVFGAFCSNSPSNSGDWDSTKRWIRETFPDVTQISTTELAGWLEAGAADRTILLDARSAQEYEVSHLEGAERAETLAAALALLSGLPQDRRIVVYCSVGYRSSALASQLREMGYANVFNLEGSIFQWANEGRPVFRNGRQVREVHPFDEDWGRLLDRSLWAWEPDSNSAD